MLLPSTRYTKVFAALGVVIVLIICLHALGGSDSSLSTNFKQYKDYYLDFATPASCFSSKPSTNANDPEPAGCRDPYRSPGYLYIPYSRESAQVAWIPYDTVDLFGMPDPETAAYPPKAEYGPTFDELPPGDDILSKAPTDWSAELLKWKETGDDSKLAWMKGKRVLLMSDSVDRIMMETICQALKTDFVNQKMHTVSWCNVPGLNFTIYHWHLASLYTARPSPDFHTHVEDIPLEARLETIFRKTVPDLISHQAPVSKSPSFGAGAILGSPSLVLFQSSFWDAVAFMWGSNYTRNANNEHLRGSERSLAWSEIKFYNARMRKLIRTTRELFGEDVPMMYRSFAGRKSMNATDVKLFDMEHITRHLCSRMGVEVFEWAKIAHGHTDQWRDNMHVRSGALSKMWVNMLLSYVFRAEGGVEVDGRIKVWPGEGTQWPDAWNRCHPYHMARHFY